MIRNALIPITAAFAGAAANVWWLSGFVPWFLLPDIPFLSIVFAGIFLAGPVGFPVSLFCAFLREITASAPPGTLFLSSMALYFFTREISRRLFFRTDTFLLVTIAVLLAAESVSLMGLLLFSGSRPLSFLWGAQEAVRIAWTTLLAVPWFMDLSGRLRRVKE